MPKREAHLLFVDDDSSIRETLPGYTLAHLSNFQLTFEVCHSGNEAWRIIQAGKQFDLIVCDYVMEDGTGIDLMRYLYRHGVETPIIIYSSAINPEFPFIPLGFLGVVDKAKGAHLLKMIEDQLTKR